MAKDQKRPSQMSDKTRLLHWLGKIGANPHCPFCGRIDPQRSDSKRYVEFTCIECHTTNRYSSDKVKKVNGE